MPGSSRLLRLTLFALTLSATLASGQRPVTPPPPGPEAIPHETGPIRLDVTVTDKKGAPVGNLQQSDFSLFEDKHPLPITSFKALGAESPAEVMIVIDDVNVPYVGIAYERDQLKKLFTRNDARLARPVSLAIVTDTEVRVLPQTTTNGNELAAALDGEQIGLRTLPRSAGFYGAQDRSTICINALRTLAERESARPGRKQMVWLSPGWPLLSGPRVFLSDRDQRAIFRSIVQLSAELRLAQITLYQINPAGASGSVLRDNYYESFLKGVPKPSKTDEADLALQVLAVQTGGLALNGSNDLAGLVKRSIDDTFGTYEITFAPGPAEHPDEYHALEVRLAQPGLTARTRTGYYAQP